MRLIVQCCVFVALATVFVGASVFAQELPQNWKSLEAFEFVTTVKANQEAIDNNPDLSNEVILHAAALLKKLVSIESDYDTLFSLQRIGRREFQQNWSKAEEIREVLRERQDAWVGKSYDEARAKITLMAYLDMTVAERVDVARRWHADGGQLADVWEEDLPFAHHVLTPVQDVTGEVTIRWTGNITPPTDGDYTFSVSSIDVNTVIPNYHEGLSWHVKKTATVNLNGIEVVRATTENWDHESKPVSLQAGTPVPVVVVVTLASSEEAEGALHALLFWEGPGISRSIVPEERLTLPDGSGPGLQGEYTWRNGEQFQRLTRTDKNIDFCWASGQLGLTEDTTVQESASQRLWVSTTDDSYLTELQASGESHPFLKAPAPTASLLSSAQRREFLRKLVHRPELLSGVAPGQFRDFYEAWRLGAPVEALDAVGLWAIQNSHHCAELQTGPTIHSRMDVHFREACRFIGNRLAHESNQLDLLQAEHLELADGNCCLPVAYMVNYGRQTLGQIDEWIAGLDQRLEQTDVTGDKRVNWLLARAHAEEIRNGSIRPFSNPQPRLQAGQRYLEEAMQSATTAETRCRCGLENVVRKSAQGQFDESRSALDAAAVEATAGQQPDIDRLRARIASVERDIEAANGEQAIAARRAYVQKLQQRRDKASAAGRTDAVARYDALISAANEGLQTP